MYNLLLYQKYVGIPKINRTPNIPKSDRTPTPSKQRFLRSASSLRDATANAIAPPHPKSDRIGKLIFLLNSVEIFIN